MRASSQVQLSRPQALDGNSAGEGDTSSAVTIASSGLLWPEQGEEEGPVGSELVSEKNTAVATEGNCSGRS